MVNLWIEGFEGSPTGREVFEQYTGTPYQATTPGDNGGVALNISNGLGVTPAIAQSAITAQVILGMRIFAEPTVPITGPSPWVGFSLGLGKQARLTLARTSGGQYLLLIRRADFFPGALLVMSSAFGNVGSWSYVEVKLTISTAANPVFSGQADGVPLTFAAQLPFNTAALGVNGFDRLEVGVVPGWYFDDMYLNDNTGAENNNFLGPRRVYALPYSGSGALSEWTAAGGAATKLLALTDGIDATQVSATADGQRELLTVPNMPALQTVDAIRFDLLASQSVPSSSTVQSAARMGATNYDLRSHTVQSTVPRPLMAVMNRRPDGTVWTPSNIADVQFGARSGA